MRNGVGREGGRGRRCGQVERVEAVRVAREEREREEGTLRDGEIGRGGVGRCGTSEWDRDAHLMNYLEIGCTQLA